MKYIKKSLYITMGVHISASSTISLLPQQMRLGYQLPAVPQHQHHPNGSCSEPVMTYELGIWLKSHWVSKNDKSKEKEKGMILTSCWSLSKIYKKRNKNLTTLASINFCLKQEKHANRPMKEFFHIKEFGSLAPTETWFQIV